MGWWKRTMRVISHGLKEKCWNNTFHERFQAHWSAMHIENPQPGITVQIDPPPAKKKKENKRTCSRRAHSEADHWYTFKMFLTGSSSSFILLVPVIKMSRNRSPENANINVKKNWMYLKLTSYLNKAFSDIFIRNMFHVNIHVSLYSFEECM